MKMEKVVKMSLMICFVVLACIMACASAQSATNVIAMYSDFKATENNWDLSESGVACSRILGYKPLEWRSKYSWTGFCGPVGPSGKEACGLCLKVSNVATKASTTVRIVDTCGINGLILDTQAFNEIDTNGQGYATGRLAVDYEFVACENEDPCTAKNKWASKLKMRT